MTNTKIKLDTISYLQYEYTVGLVIPKTIKKAIILLHGAGGTFRSTLNEMNLRKFATHYNTLIVVPEMEERFYIDKSGRKPVDSFVTEKLTSFINDNCGLEKVPIHIAGVSMGGYGSLLIGLHHPHIFKSIASISGAFIADYVVLGSPMIGATPDNYAKFSDIFGDEEGHVWNLDKDTLRNPQAILQETKDLDKLPPIFITCSEIDPWYESNLKILTLLEQRNIMHLWKNTRTSRCNRGHNRREFRKGLKFVLDNI